MWFTRGQKLRQHEKVMQAGTIQVTVVREAGWESFFTIWVRSQKAYTFRQKKLNFMIKINNIYSEEHWKNLG